MANLTRNPRELARLIETNASQDRPKRKTEKKMGVWVDGKLKLQSRDREKIESYMRKMLADRRHSGIWVAPVGSFVTTGEK